MIAAGHRWVAVAGLLTAMLLWGSSFVVLKLAFRYYEPMFVIFGRMVVASFCFMFFWGRFRHNDYQRGDWKHLLVMALFEPCLYFLFEAKAVQNTTASQAGMITAILPLMVAVSAQVFLKESIGKRTLLGFVLAVAGVCWLSLSSEATSEAPNPHLGNFLQFMAMVCATGYTIAIKKLTFRYNPIFLTAVQALVGSVFFLQFVLWGAVAVPKTFEVVPAMAVVYLGVFITVGAYGLYNYGLSCIPASQAAAYVNLIPVFTLLLAWIVLGERFTPGQYAASLLVLLGVFLSQDKRSHEAPARKDVLISRRIPE